AAGVAIGVAASIMSLIALRLLSILRLFGIPIHSVLRRIFDIPIHPLLTAAVGVLTCVVVGYVREHLAAGAGSPVEESHPGNS
ncbi:MAG: hypothetical protein ACYTE3_28405, partial [Planctomycetota bacterium]